MNMNELKEMLHKSAAGVQALSDSQIEKVSGGASYLEEIKSLIDAQKEKIKNQPFPSFVDGMYPLMQKAYDHCIAYQEENGIILDDQTAEKLFWEHMAGKHTAE